MSLETSGDQQAAASSVESRGPDADPALLGSWRSLAPAGALVHIADRVDAESDANEYEAEVDVEMLNVDATSFRQLRESRASAEGVAAAIAETVAARGKLQNPVTGSGGILVGRLTRIGSARHEAEDVGDRVVPIASLIATPLRLHSVGPVDLGSPQVPVSGRAIVTGRMGWAKVPDDLPLDAVLTALDVYPAPWHTHVIARSGHHVVIIGSGHAGLAATVAAREAVGSDGDVTVIDVSERALELARSVDPTVSTIVADATNPAAVAAEFARHDLPKSDLTLLCATVAGCEGTAILLTKDEGTVLFFSTATSFSAAALGADSLSSLAHLAIPNGFTPDRGSYLIELLRRTPALLDTFTRKRAPRA